MSKIIVIGAGIGGLISATELGKAGHEVSIYEKSREGEVSYDWHDDAAPAIFRELDIPLPDKKYYHEKPDWSFYRPALKQF